MALNEESRIHFNCVFPGKMKKTETKESKTDSHPIMNPLTREEMRYASLQFQVLIYASNGQAYEDLFVRVMSERSPSFKPVKPHGAAGDKKNDGYDPPHGRYYQVFAPENSSESVVTAVSKARQDFTGLLAYWNSISPIREFRFVYNDKFHGPYPELEAELHAIGQENELSVSSVFLAQDLLREFGLLDQQGMMCIIGLLPDPANLQALDFSSFAEVLRFLLANPVTLEPDSLLRVPDFNEKIKFNGLSAEVGALLTHGSFQSGSVRHFFDSVATVSKTEVRDKLAGIYEFEQNRSKEESWDLKSARDLIFFGILDEIVPDKTRSFQDAAIVLMSYFFESCDIFEDPALLS
jgi:hypothetical protein